MSGRRPRLVIKPNIRPGIAKTTSAPKPKPAVASSTADTPTSTKNIQALASSEKAAVPEEELKETNQRHSNDHGKPHVPAPESEVKSSGRGEAAAPQNESSTEFVKRHEQPKAETALQSIPSDKEESSVTAVETTQDAALSPAVQSVAVSLTSLKPKTLTTDLQAGGSSIDSPAVSSHHVEDSGSSQKAEAANKRLDVEEEEVDGSEMSVASSLDPNAERLAEVEETTEKKPRRQRSKKPKLEALPSRDKSPDRQKMKMSDLLLWNPERNFLPSKPKKKRNPKDENRPSSPAESVSVDGENDSTKETESAALPAPQVMIGPDGNVVLNTESLLITSPEKDSNRPTIIVEEDDDDRYLNTNSYRKYYKKKLWSEEETDRFFKGLSMCGTDFSLLTKLLTNRSRRELKNKFRREEKYNRARVDESLTNMQQYDPSEFVEKPPPPPKPKPKKQAAISTATKKEKEKKEPKAPAKREEGAAKKKAKKRKRPELSEDEEDDWGPEYDEVDEEEELAARLPAYKRPQRKAAAACSWKGEMEVDEETEQNGKADASVISDSPSAVNPVTPSAKQADAVVASTSSPSAKMSSSQRPAPPLPSRQPAPIPAIPGTTQVQIEVSGVDTPVQGMLIPSHMVPSLAPQLGLGEGVLGGRVQVLLVHEESADGSLVHVYIIPEGSSAPTATAPSVPSQPNISVTSASCQQGTQRGAHPVQSHHPLQQKIINVHASPTAPQSTHAPVSPGNVTPAPFPPTSSAIRTPSPFPPIARLGSNSPFPPYSRKSRISSPLTPGSASIVSPMQNPSGVRSQSPFPPQPGTGRKLSPFPPTPSPTLQKPGISSQPTASRSPSIQSPLPMSPPPLQGHAPLGRIVRPLPQTHSLSTSQAPVRNIYLQDMKSTSSTTSVSPHSSSRIRTDPPTQNLLSVTAVDRAIPINVSNNQTLMTLGSHPTKDVVSIGQSPPPASQGCATVIKFPPQPPAQSTQTEGVKNDPILTGQNPSSCILNKRQSGEDEGDSSGAKCEPQETVVVQEGEDFVVVGEVEKKGPSISKQQQR